MGAMARPAWGALQEQEQGLGWPRGHPQSWAGLTVPSGAPLEPQGIVQGHQLPQEAAVGDDPAVVLDRLYGFHQGHVVADHEVGEDQGGRPADPDGAVHEDPPWRDTGHGGCVSTARKSPMGELLSTQPGVPRALWGTQGCHQGWQCALVATNGQNRPRSSSGHRWGL